MRRRDFAGLLLGAAAAGTMMSSLTESEGRVVRARERGIGSEG